LEVFLKHQSCFQKIPPKNQKTQCNTIYKIKTPSWLFKLGFFANPVKMIMAVKRSVELCWSVSLSPGGKSGPAHTHRNLHLAQPGQGDTDFSYNLLSYCTVYLNLKIHWR